MGILKIEQGTEFDFNVKWRLTNCCNFQCSYCARKNKRQKTSDINTDQKIIEGAIGDVARLIVSNNKPTKLSLIGGEVTLLDLPKILTKLFSLTNHLIKKVFIVTNFSREYTYFNNLIDICKDNETILSLTCSWHNEFISLDAFVEKYNKLNKNSYFKIKFETVCTETNKDKVNKFINVCKGIGVEYSVDADLTNSNVNNLTITSNKTSRCKVTKDDGSIVYCDNISSLIRDFGDWNTRIIPLKDYYCSLDYTYVYIEQDKHVGYNANLKTCKYKEPLKNFSLKKEPVKCPNGCSLCGNMAVSRNKEDLIK